MLGGSFITNREEPGSFERYVIREFVSGKPVRPLFKENTLLLFRRVVEVGCAK